LIMKYTNEFRQKEPIQALLQRLRQEIDPERTYHLMEFCGGHTHALYQYGLMDLLPSSIEMHHGPGCPVCVLPMYRIAKAIALAKLPQVIFCSYGDMLRVPGPSGYHLMHAKAEGADVRMVYSIDDALQIAQRSPDRSIIFFAIGFETTAPSTAAAILKAQNLGLTNFFVYNNHLIAAAALLYLLQMDKSFSVDETKNIIQGFIGPGHVSSVIGMNAFIEVSCNYCKPIVITGFEPIDLLQSIIMLVKQINRGTFQVENQYTRVVTREGNIKSQNMMRQVFDIVPSFEWRGLGELPSSAFQLKSNYEKYDAEKQFIISFQMQSKDQPSVCECAAILRGQKKPKDCLWFGQACSPEHPLGACMV
jgi:hydrogenase expression/formation protein HypD